MDRVDKACSVAWICRPNPDFKAIGKTKKRFNQEEKNMPIEKAVYNTVHEASGGGKAVAFAMGLSYQVLVNKVNLKNTTHHLTLKEAVDVMRATKDTRILDALASEFNGVFLPLPALTSDISPNLMTDMAKMSSEFGSLLKEISDDLSDGGITENEWMRIDNDATKLREALAVLMGDLRRVYKASQNAAV
jgi:hypothetical protein